MESKRVRRGKTIAERLFGVGIANPGSKKLRDLLQLLSEVSNGRLSAAEVARRYGVNRSTVLRWVAAYRKRGSAFLSERLARPGRRRKFTSSQEAWIIQTLTKGKPSDFGLAADVWTGLLITELFHRKYGPTPKLSESKVSRLRQNYAMRRQK